MRKILIGVVVIVAIALVGVAQAATVTHATFQSGIFDETTNTFYPMTCDETQVVNQNHRKETFHCTFDEAVPSPGVFSTAKGNAVWFSDFDGAEATSTHWAFTPAGSLQGWARYS